MATYLASFRADNKTTVVYIHPRGRLPRFVRTSQDVCARRSSQCLPRSRPTGNHDSVSDFKRIFRSLRLTIATCLVALLSVLLLPGCEKAGGPRKPAGQGQAAQPGMGDVPVEIDLREGRRVVRHTCGETIIPDKPERVVAFALADPMFFLGLKPVAQAGIWDWKMEGHYLNPYLDGVGHVGGVYGGRMPNVESAMSFKPDLILLDSPNAQTYLRMKCVAPTVVLDANTAVSSNDRQRALDVGKLCGVESRARKAIAWYDRKLALAKAAIHEEIGDERVGIMWFFVKQLRTYNCDVLYKQLELQPPSLLNMDPHVFLGVTVLNLEQIGDYDADHMFVIWADQPDRNLNLSQAECLPLWDRIPAVRNGSVHHVSVSNWAGGGILGSSKVITEVVEALVPASKRPPELERYLKDRPDDEDLAQVELSESLDSGASTLPQSFAVMPAPPAGGAR